MTTNAVNLRAQKSPIANRPFYMKHLANRLFLPATAISLLGCGEVEIDETPTPMQTPKPEITPITLNCGENTDCYVEKKYEDQGTCFVNTDKKSNITTIECSDMMEYNYTFLIFAPYSPLQVKDQATIYIAPNIEAGLDINLSGTNLRSWQTIVSFKSAAAAYAIEIGEEVQAPGGFNSSCNFLTFEDDASFEESHAITIQAASQPLFISYIAVEFMSPSDIFIVKFAPITIEY